MVGNSMGCCAKAGQAAIMANTDNVLVKVLVSLAVTAAILSRDVREATAISNTVAHQMM